MRLEKSGKSQGKSHKILENWGNFRQMLFVIFQWQLNEFVYYLVNLIKFSVKKQSLKKILENGKKYWKSQGILSVRKSGNPELIQVWNSDMILIIFVCFSHWKVLIIIKLPIMEDYWLQSLQTRTLQRWLNFPLMKDAAGINTALQMKMWCLPVLKYSLKTKEHSQ